MSKDVLIVGFGLAGLSVARHLELSNYSFDIISDRSQQSSKIAGGIINPVAIKRMKPVWLVEEFLPFANNFYKGLDDLLKIKSFRSRKIKVFIHKTEQENNWYVAKEKMRLNPYLSSKVFNNDDIKLNIDKLGEVNASMVDLSLLFQSATKYYMKLDLWTTQTFNYSELQILNNYISYRNQNYKHIIFCDGFGVLNNPYFNNLGIYGNKGDYLIFKSNELRQDTILKSKYFLIPLGNGLYKFGATYQREPLNHTPSETAKKQMLEALNKMINVNYEIIDQTCGIRPTTRDRRPIVGSHSKHKQLHILNGLGSRGVMMAPKLGQQLCEHILEGKELSPEISTRRFDAQT